MRFTKRVSIKKMQFLGVFMSVIIYSNSQIYANSTINKIINLTKENKKLDSEIIKLIRFELCDEIEDIPKIILKGCDNHLWLFKIYKSSIPVNNSIAVYQLARLFGIKTPLIYEISLPINRKMVYGSIQRFIDNATTIDDIFPWMLSKSQIESLQRHQILDYFVCNPDVGGDNFLLKRENGDIIGIDKDESFCRVLNSPLDVWDNNPYYNRFWDAYIKRKIDIDFETSFQLIDYIQSIDTKMIEHILNPLFYEREAILKLVISRKDKLRPTFEKFYQGLAKKSGENFQFQISVRNKGKYAEYVLEKMEEIVLQKRKCLEYLQSNAHKKQQNIEIVFSQKGFDKVMTLENVSTKDVFIVGEKVLNELKTLRKNTSSIYEKFALSLYIYSVEDILKERPLEHFLEEPIENIIKSSKEINIFSLEYTLQTAYALPRQVFSKILKELNQHPQDILKHLSFVQSLLSCKEKETIFEEYKKQKGFGIITKFIYGLLFDEIEYLNDIEDTFAWKYLGKGLIYWSRGYRNEAIQEYQKATSLSDDKTINFWGYRLLGFVYEHNPKRVRFGEGFDIERAIANYRKALEIMPDSVEVRLNLAGLYLIKKSPEKALEEFKEIKKLDSQYAKEHFHFENIKVESNYKNKKDYLKAVKINTLSREQHYVLGLAYAVKKDYKNAKKHFNAAREFGYEVDVKLK